MKYLLTIAVMGMAMTLAPSCKKKSSGSSTPAPVVETPTTIEPVAPVTPVTPTTTAITGFNCETSSLINLGSNYSMIVDTTQNKLQLTKDGQSLVYTMLTSTKTVLYAPQSTRYDLTLIDANGTAVAGEAGYLALEPDTINYITKQDRGYRHAWLSGVPFDSKTIQLSQFSCK